MKVDKDFSLDSVIANYLGRIATKKSKARKGKMPKGVVIEEYKPKKKHWTQLPKNKNKLKQVLKKMRAAKGQK